MSIQDLIDKRANNWEHQKALLATRVEDATGILQFKDAEDKAKWENLSAEYDTLDDAINREETIAGRSAIGNIKPSTAPAVGDPNSIANDEAYGKAFNKYLRGGLDALEDGNERKLLSAGFQKVQNANTVAPGTAGGYTVPPLFREKVINRLQFLVAMRQYAEVITTAIGGALPWPTNDDTGVSAYILGEATAATDNGSQDLVFGTNQLHDWMYVTGVVRASFQLLNDSFLDVDDYLAKKFALRMARRQIADFTNGTGVNQPLGIVTGGNVAVTAAAQTTIAYGELVSLTESIDEAYLMGENCAWMAAQSCRKVLRQVVDTMGHPLWQPSLQVGAPNTLLGWAFAINNSVPAPAASAKSLLFGDIEQAYVIRDVNDFTVLRLNERYADALEVGFLGFQRSDGTVQDGNAYALLQQHA